MQRSISIFSIFCLPWNWKKKEQRPIFVRWKWYFDVFSSVLEVPAVTIAMAFEILRGKRYEVNYFHLDHSTGHTMRGVKYWLDLNIASSKLNSPYTLFFYSNIRLRFIWMNPSNVNRFVVFNLIHHNFDFLRFVVRIRPHVKRFVPILRCMHTMYEHVNELWTEQQHTTQRSNSNFELPLNVIKVIGVRTHTKNRITIWMYGLVWCFFPHSDRSLFPHSKLFAGNVL